MDIQVGPMDSTEAVPVSPALSENCCITVMLLQCPASVVNLILAILTPLNAVGNSDQGI